MAAQAGGGNQPWVVGKAEGPFGVILDERAGTPVVRVVVQVVEHYMAVRNTLPAHTAPLSPGEKAR